MTALKARSVAHAVGNRKLLMTFERDNPYIIKNDFYGEPEVHGKCI